MKVKLRFDCKNYTVVWPPDKTQQSKDEEVNQPRKSRLGI